MKSIKLNEGLENIDNRAFEDVAIEKLETPSTLKSIGSCTFGSCKNLTSIKLNEGLENIDGTAFYETAIKKLETPSTLKSIRICSI